MRQEKVIFIIPGFRQRVTNRAYTQIANFLKQEGYIPISVSIPWKNSTISENTAYFLKIFKQVKARKKYILGFSYGAMIAFIASTKVSVSGLLLCSLSPYFKEDVSKKARRAQSALQKQRYTDFEKFHSVQIARSTKAKKIIMVYGTLEARSLITRVKVAFGQISTKKELIAISKTQHEIGKRQYLSAIQSITKDLL